MFRINPIRIVSVYLLSALLTFTGISGQGLLIGPSGYFITNGPANLVLNNAGINNNGVFEKSTGKVIFSGNNPTNGSFVSGTVTTSFYDLVLNKSANGMLLNTDISVTDSLIFISGDSLFLNTHILDLANSGILSGESENSRITGLTGGYIQRTISLNHPSAVNAGNLGLTITSSSDLGTTVIRRGHSIQSGGGYFGIARYYDVLPANNSGLGTSIVFTYFDAELNTISEDNLTYFESSDFGTTWALIGNDTKSSSSDFVEYAPVNELYRLTLGDIFHPLPVTLLSFKGYPVDHYIHLSWVTGSESGSSCFDLERSKDGTGFSKINTITEPGYSNTVHSYSCNDYKPENGMNYYRLRQTDKNGKVTYSSVIAVFFRETNSGYYCLYPNPCTDNLNIVFTSPGSMLYTFILTDMKGTVLQRRALLSCNGMNSFNINTAALTPGYYTVLMLNNNSSRAIPFTKNGQ